MADPLLGGVALVAALAAYPASVVAGLLWHQRSEGQRVATARRDWGKLASLRGLSGGDRAIGGGAFQLSYAGLYRGRSVALDGQTSAPVHGWTAVRAGLHPAMDLGLHAAGTPWSPYARAAGLFASSADEPARAAGLFDAAVKAALRRLEAVDWVISDQGVLLRRPTLITDPLALGAMLDLAVDVAEVLDRARRTLGPAGPLRSLAPAWDALARSRGLDALAAPLAIAGKVDGVDVAAAARRADRLQYGLGAEARFSSPLGGVLGLVPTAAGALAPWLGVHASDLGGQDVPLSDPPFDQAFLVRSRTPERLPRILGGDLRGRLLALHERTPLVLDDLALRIASERLPPPEALPRLLGDLAALAGEIEQRVRSDGGSPYR